MPRTMNSRQDLDGERRTMLLELVVKLRIAEKCLAGGLNQFRIVDKQPWLELLADGHQTRAPEEVEEIQHSAHPAPR